MEGSQSIAGEKHFNAKLTEDSVRRIRKLRGDGVSFAELSAMFGVADDAVRRVVNRRTWKHVP